MILVWTAEARRNLLTIAETIAKDSSPRAIPYISKIKSRANSLEKFPKIGRIVPEYKENAHPLREMIMDPYRLIYRIHGNAVEIITVYHGKRLLPSLP